MSKRESLGIMAAAVLSMFMYWAGGVAKSRPLVIRPPSPPQVTTICVMSVDVPEAVLFSGMLFSELDWQDVYGRPIPRCRNVPDGTGCIDVLGAGETWETVLASRPKMAVNR